MIPGKTIIGGSSAEHARHASDFYETPDEYERLRFADRLDAYMWAKHHAPHVLDPDSTVKEYLTVQTDDPSSCCQSDPLLHFLPLLY